MESSTRNNLIIGVVVGLVLGLLLGMLVFWVVFPVEWTDARSYDLAPDARAEYVALVADSFALDTDPARAAKYLELWTVEEKEQAFAAAVDMYEAEARPDKAVRVQDLAIVLGVQIPEAGASLPEPTPQAGFFERIRIPCLVFFFVLLVS